MRAALLLSLTLAGFAHAATLKELLDSAEQRNVDRLIAGKQRERAEWESRQAWTSLLPSLTAQGNWTNNQYPVEDIPNPFVPGTTLTLVRHNQLDAFFRIDLPIIDTTRWFRYASASSASEAATQRDAASRDLIRRQVVAMWFRYAGALALRESANRSLKAADAQAALMEVRTKAGASTELDLLRARAESARNQQLLTAAEEAVANNRHSLLSLTGIDPGDEAQLPADDTRPPTPFAELERNVGELPAVKAARADAAAAGHVLTAQRLAPLPSLGAQFTERLTNAAGFAGQGTSYTAGLGFSWRLDVPTFMGMGSAAANKSAADLGIERARIVAMDQLFTDWQTLNSALKRIESARTQVAAAARAAQVGRDRFAVGAATQLDVITAERDLFTSEAALIQARGELGAARLGVQLSAGLPLELP